MANKFSAAAGAAALIAAQYPSLSVTNMKASMLGSVTPVAGLSGYCQTSVSPKQPAFDNLCVCVCFVCVCVSLVLKLCGGWPALYCSIGSQAKATTLESMR